MEKAIKKFPRKKRRKRTRREVLILVVFCCVIAGFLCKLVSQQMYLSEIRNEKKQCEQQIASLEEQKKTLEREAKYNSSDDYYEEKLRDEGYIRDDEIAFVIVN